MKNYTLTDVIDYIEWNCMKDSESKAIQYARQSGMFLALVKTIDYAGVDRTVGYYEERIDEYKREQ